MDVDPKDAGWWTAAIAMLGFAVNQFAKAAKLLTRADLDHELEKMWERVHAMHEENKTELREIRARLDTLSDRL